MKSKNRSKRSGVAAAEFAVCLPVLVLLLMGSIETCSMIFVKQSLACAAYEGTRKALQPNATAADVRRACLDLLGDRNVRGATVTITPSDLTLAREGEYIRVQVSATAAANAVTPLRFYNGRTLEATASMMKEI